WEEARIRPQPEPLDGGDETALRPQPPARAGVPRRQGDPRLRLHALHQGRQGPEGRLRRSLATPTVGGRTGFAGAAVFARLRRRPWEALPALPVRPFRRRA